MDRASVLAVDVTYPNMLYIVDVTCYHIPVSY